MQIDISKSAGRALRRSNKHRLIARKIIELAENPDAFTANVVKLTARNGYRLRVQDWRIIFRIEGDILHIDEIEPRGSIYEDRT